MKKVRFFCAALSFVFAGQVQGEFSLFDFFKWPSSSDRTGEKNQDISLEEQQVQEGFTSESELPAQSEEILAVEKKDFKESEEACLPSEEGDYSASSHSEVLSDKVLEISATEKQPLENDVGTEDNHLKINQTITTSDGVSAIRELLRNIQTSMVCLASGRMSNEDYEKLTHKKEDIDSLIESFNSSHLIYEKICAFEKILMEYNSVCDISVYFLQPIEIAEINIIQRLLFSSEISSLKEELTYAFKTDIDGELKESIQKFQEVIGEGNLSEIIEKIKQSVLEIPRELLDANQCEKIEKLLSDIKRPIYGNFRDKCSVLGSILKSYNEVRNEPFRLKKVNPVEMKNIVLKMIDNVFFEKMLNMLRVMEECGYSDKSDCDEEVLASRNIQKARLYLLGGISFSGQEIKGSINQFRSSQSLKEKQNLLENSIKKFNKAVGLFKKASDVLALKGVNHKMRGTDEILTIDESIDTIFKKISVYENLESRSN